MDSLNTLHKVHTLLSYSYCQRHTYSWVVGNVTKGLGVQRHSVPAPQETEKKYSLIHNVLWNRL